MQPVKVLFLPASYPSEINPVAGIFIKEHAELGQIKEIVGKINKFLTAEICQHAK